MTCRVFGFPEAPRQRRPAILAPVPSVIPSCSSANTSTRQQLQLSIPRAMLSMPLMFVLAVLLSSPPLFFSCLFRYQASMYTTPQARPAPAAVECKLQGNSHAQSQRNTDADSAKRMSAYLLPENPIPSPGSFVHCTQIPILCDGCCMPGGSTCTAASIYHPCKCVATTAPCRHRPAKVPPLSSLV